MALSPAGCRDWDRSWSSWRDGGHADASDQRSDSAPPNADRQIGEDAEVLDPSCNDSNLPPRPSFGAIEEVAGRGSTPVRGSSVSADGAVLVYSEYSSTYKIRWFIGDQSGYVGNITMPSDDIMPTLNADGTLLIFATDRQGTVGGFDLWQTSRASGSYTWSDPVWLSVSSSVDEYNPNLSADGNTLLFARSSATENSSIWRCVQSGTTWQTPTKVTELDTDDNEEGAALFPDGRTIIFASSRRSPQGLRFFTARRPTTEGEFVCILPVPNSFCTDPEDRETDAFVTRDGTMLYFTGIGSTTRIYRRPISAYP
jgi:Tol biopolymer transport system component